MTSSQDHNFERNCWKVASLPGCSRRTSASLLNLPSCYLSLLTGYKPFQYPRISRELGGVLELLEAREAINKQSVWRWHPLSLALPQMNLGVRWTLGKPGRKRLVGLGRHPHPRLSCEHGETKNARFAWRWYRLEGPWTPNLVTHRIQLDWAGCKGVRNKELQGSGTWSKNHKFPNPQRSLHVRDVSEGFQNGHMQTRCCVGVNLRYYLLSVIACLFFNSANLEICLNNNLVNGCAPHLKMLNQLLSHIGYKRLLTFSDELLKSAFAMGVETKEFLLL